MTILGIETSCDETGISLIEIKKEKIKILTDLLFSQVKVHAKYGGVFPTLAKREHKKNLPILFKKVKEKIKNKKINVVAVTVGPGLEMCLWEGINFAKEISKNLNLAIVPVNHIEAHFLINFLPYFSKISFLESKILPAICLVVSGGHTQLILMEKIGKYKLLGETRDDAAGECLDKVARLLNLGYPGGPKIEKLAKLKIRNLKFKINLPRPMINQKNFDFSFAGLKTAVLYDYLERKKTLRNSKEYKILMAKEVQQAIIDVLLSKTMRAVKEFNLKTVILGGGVAANEKLRKIFKRECRKLRFNFFVPKKKYCQDNGLMVAFTAFFHLKEATKNFDKIKAEANLKI